MTFRTVFGLFVIIFALLLSACGGESSTPQATPVQLQRASYVSTRLNPGFAVHFPTSWRYQVSEAGIMLSNDPDLLSAPAVNPEMPGGSLAMNISLLTEEQVRSIGARNAAGLIDAFVGSSNIDALAPKYRDTNAITIEGRDGAQAFVSTGGSDSLLLALDLQGNFVLAVVVAPKDELKQHTGILNSIFASVELLKTQ